MNYLVALKYLPEEDSPIAVLTTIQVLLRNIGIELGDKYTKQLSRELGENWLVDLGVKRERLININDPQFVLSEPLRNSDSPTRNCLPRGREFYDKLEKVLYVRNAWAHHEVTDLSFETLLVSVEVIRTFSRDAGLALARQCAEIQSRVEEIQQGIYGPSRRGATKDLKAELFELQRELVDANDRKRRAVEDYEAAQALLDGAALGPSVLDPGVVYVPDPALEIALAEALSEKERLEFLIQSIAAVQDATSDSADADQRGVGHKWEGKLPSRRVTIPTFRDDLFDLDEKRYIASDFGVHAPAVIAKWKKLVPANSTILLSTNGRGISFMNGDPIYLGSLGDSPESQTAAIVGFFVAHNYVLKINGDIEDRDTGRALKDCHPHPTRDIGAELIMLRPTGGPLRLTTEGVIAVRIKGNWIPTLQIAPEEWFPAHLT